MIGIEDAFPFSTLSSMLRGFAVHPHANCGPRYSLIFEGSSTWPGSNSGRIRSECLNERPDQATSAETSTTIGSTRGRVTGTFSLLNLSNAHWLTCTEVRGQLVGVRADLEAAAKRLPICAATWRP
jgi:hypothetical protein